VRGFRRPFGCARLPKLAATMCHASALAMTSKPSLAVEEPRLDLLVVKSSSPAHDPKPRSDHSSSPAPVPKPRPTKRLWSDHSSSPAPNVQAHKLLRSARTIRPLSPVRQGIWGAQPPAPPQLEPNVVPKPRPTKRLPSDEPFIEPYVFQSSKASTSGITPYIGCTSKAPPPVPPQSHSRSNEQIRSLEGRSQLLNSLVKPPQAQRIEQRRIFSRERTPSKTEEGFD
jgi:hypothetical protein